MAGVWSIIVPQRVEYTNLVTNPSIEIDTTGYTAVGTTLSRAVGYGSRGYYGLNKLAAGVSDGFYYSPVVLANGVTYTWGVDVKATAGTYKMYFADAAGALKGTATTFTITSASYWTRQYVTWTSDAAASFRLYLIKDNWVGGADIYIDCMSVIATTLHLTYFDGDTPNCRWSGTAHASSSVCPATARNVGVVTDLLDYNLRVLSVDGVGTVDATHQVAQYAVMPGAEYKGHKVQPRYITLTNAVYGTSLENLHSKRKIMVDLFGHDFVAGDQPIILRYTGANSLRPLEITCYLDQEIGAFDLPKIQRNAIRLFAPDPYFYDVYETAEALSVGSSSTQRYFSAKRNADWDTNGIDTPSAVTDPGSGIKVRGMVMAGSFSPSKPRSVDNQNLWVCGYFLNWDGIAAADYICRYDFTAGDWAAIEAGTNGYVRQVAIAPNGYIYACGEFTQIGATAANRIAYWNGAAWTAMGTGFDGTAYDVMVAKDGKVYAVGNDATIGGVASAAYVAYWDGAAWQAMSTGISAVAYALAEDGAGNIYIGGTQTGYVTKWNGTTFTSLAAPALCWALKVAPNGTIYAGLGGSEYIKMWNGQAWVSMAGGVTTGNFIYGLDIDANGMLWAGGDFTAVGGLTVNGLACWNGYSWVHPDIQLPASSIVYSIYCNGNDVYLGYDTSGTTYYSYNNPHVDNKGTAPAYPIISINRSGGTTSSLRYLRNDTTGATIYLNYNILDGETVYLDFNEKSRSIISSYYGSIWRGVLRGSQFTEFFLTPSSGSGSSAVGASKISAFVYSTGAPTITRNIRHTDRHESIDGAAA